MYIRTHPSFEFNNHTINNRIKENLPIQTLEAIAIHEAIIYIISQNIKKVTIITDFLSTCNILRNQPNYKNFYELQIFKMITIHKLTINIIWTSSHINVQGNDKADTEAKLGATGDNYIEIATPCKTKELKLAIYETWRSEFINRTETKRKQHRENTNNKFRDKPWFHKKS